MNGERTAAGDRGSTFVEALLALALFACACSGAAAGAHTALTALRTVRNLADVDSRLIRADALLRRSISRVYVPARAARLAAERSERGLQLAWLDGDPHHFLELSFRNSELLIRDRHTVERIGPFASVSFSICRCRVEERFRAVGPVVCCRIEEAGGEIVFVRAQTATWPLVPQLGGNL